MKKTIMSLMILTGIHGIAVNLAPAHLMEPLETETATTVPPGRMSGHVEYLYTEHQQGSGIETTSHLLPIEFEVGVGNRTQLNIEASLVLKEKNDLTSETEKGIEEIAIGLKHRFIEETRMRPNAAFLVEFAPSTGLEGNSSELMGALVLSKTPWNRFPVHVEAGYIYETERETRVSGATVTTEVVSSGILIYRAAPGFQVIPDRFLLAVELTGETHLRGWINNVSIAPEFILVVGKSSLKLGILIGLSEEANDIGVHFGLSRLF